MAVAGAEIMNKVGAKIMDKGGAGAETKLFGLRNTAKMDKII